MPADIIPFLWGIAPLNQYIELKQQADGKLKPHITMTENKHIALQCITGNPRHKGRRRYQHQPVKRRQQQSLSAAKRSFPYTQIHK